MPPSQELQTTCGGRFLALNRSNKRSFKREDADIVILSLRELQKDIAHGE
jgi:hypothetical protein